MNQQAKGVVRAEVFATVTRADGTVEELGSIAYWHRNPLRRLKWRIANRVKALRSRRRG